MTYGGTVSTLSGPEGGVVGPKQATPFLKVAVHEFNESCA
jgi:hypothetical protein